MIPRNVELDSVEKKRAYKLIFCLTSLNLSIASKLGLGNFSKDWVVSSGGAGDGLEEPVGSLEGQFHQRNVKVIVIPKS